MDKLYASCNLCSIPFLGHTDNTRLQMSSKQLGQALTNIRCEVPKVIGSNFRYLSYNSTLFRMVAEHNGIVTFVNDDIMIITYMCDDGTDRILSIDVSPIIQCTSLSSTKLRYKREVGCFSKGDILYEYDSFKHSIPTYGYNLWTAYIPFFGFNHEDSVVISEDVSEKCRGTKLETIIIPIYKHSLFKQIYDTQYGFIPDIGEKIKDNIVSYKSVPRNNKNVTYYLKSMNITDFSSVISNELIFNSTPITSRIKNGTVIDIRTHCLNKTSLIDRKLDVAICDLHRTYLTKINIIYEQLQQIHGIDYAKEILTKHYVLMKESLNRLKYSRDLAYMIELKIAGETKTVLGDKIANRYAHKGIVSLVLPNELRPFAVKSKKPIDVLVGPISVISRMNFGQVIEGYIGKVVTKAERMMLSDTRQIPAILDKLSIIAKSLGDERYSNEITSLSSNIRNDSILHEQFAASIRDIGLYFEGQNFAKFNEFELYNNIVSLFDITVNEPVILKRKTLQYLKDKLEIDVDLPHNDIILDNVYAAPIYTLKLKQEAADRLSSRDFGNYKATNKQPIQGKDKNGSIGHGRRLGHMEFDGLFAHNCPKTIVELRTVKNDNRQLKTELTQQILTTGDYHLPNNCQTSTSYSKLIIDSLIDFLNS